MEHFSYTQFLSNVEAPDSFYMRALYAQYCLETGNGTSRIFREAKNLFGMRPAQTRTRFYISTFDTATGTYAVYSAPSESVKDRVDLDRFNNVNIPTKDAEVIPYFAQVKAKGYATDPMYVDSLTRVYKSNFANLPSPEGSSQPELADYGIADEQPAKPNKFLIPIIIVVIIVIGGYFWYKSQKQSQIEQ